MMVKAQQHSLKQLNRMLLLEVHMRHLDNVVVSRYVTHGDEVSVATLLQVVLSSDISMSKEVTVPVPEKLNDKV